MQRRHESTVKTKNAALLAAEAAFAPPRQTAEQLFDWGSSRITVLRAKGVSALLDRADSVPCSVSDSATAGEAQFLAPKAPRVFLLTSAHDESGSTPSESPLREGQAEEAGPAAPPFLGLGGMESTPVRRARRSRSRPPPVTRPAKPGLDPVVNAYFGWPRGANLAPWLHLPLLPTAAP